MNVQLSILVIIVVFSVSALAKLFSLNQFILSLENHPLLKRFSKKFAHVVALEMTIACAFIFRIAQDFFIPFTFSFISFLSILSFLDKFKYKAESCSCFGGIFKLPFFVKIILLSFLLICGFSLINSPVISQWSGVDAGIALCSCYLLFFVLSNVLYKNQRLQLGVLKEGNHFSPVWFGENNRKLLDDGDYYFIDCSCEHCSDLLLELAKNKDRNIRAFIFQTSKCTEDHFKNVGLHDVKTYELSTWKFKLLTRETPVKLTLQNGKVISVQ